MTIETISPDKMSDDQLAKALETPDDGIQPDESVIPDDGQPDDDTVVDSTEPPPDGEQTAAPPAATSDKPEETMEDRLAKLEKRLADKDRFIDERNAEIGRLRKLVEEPQKLHEVNQDNFFEDPVGSVEKITENQKAKLERELAKRELRVREESEKRREFLRQHSSDYEQNIDAVAEVLRQDGFDDAGIQAFKSNPFVYEASLLHNLNIRAKLAKENAELKAELAKLRGNNPRKILDKMEAAARQKPKIGSGTAGAKGGTGLDVETLDERAISRLTDAQLKELLSKHRRK